MTLSFMTILVLTLLFYSVGVVYFRLTGRTIIGLKFDPGTPEYKRLKRLSSTPGLVLAMLLTLTFASSLAAEIHRLMYLRASGRYFLAALLPVIFAMGYTAWFLKKAAKQGVSPKMQPVKRAKGGLRVSGGRSKAAYKDDWRLP